MYFKFLTSFSVLWFTRYHFFTKPPFVQLFQTSPWRLLGFKNKMAIRLELFELFMNILILLLCPNQKIPLSLKSLLLWLDICTSICYVMNGSLSIDPLELMIYIFSTYFPLIIPLSITQMHCMSLKKVIKWTGGGDIQKLFSLFYLFRS